MKCEYCDLEHNGTWGSGRFCSERCARGFATSGHRDDIHKRISDSLRGRKLTEDQKRKIGESLKGRKCSSKTRRKISETWRRKKDAGYHRKMSQEHRSKISESICKYWTHNPYAKTPKSILEISMRTARKIIVRMNLPCSRCGWKEGFGDIYHIFGKKILNADSHDNLAYVCPNCHRLAHMKKIRPEELISLTAYIGDKWLKAYYG
jgi:hypothetical protein